jgi:hypothetical protein
MNVNDETFLTAYLDGELTPQTRDGVASSLAVDAHLREDLRSLTAVRDLVASLSRPSGLDVSMLVLDQIGRRSSFADRWSTRAVALGATAAALVALVSVGLVRTSTPRHGLVTQAVVRPPAPRTGPGGIIEAAPVEVTAELPANPWAEPQAREARPDSERIRRMLENPGLHRVFVVADVIGGDADRQVGEFIDRTPRRHASYGRITVTQAITIDPEHPGRATVYAVLMDDLEVAELRAQLNRTFAGVKESEPRHELMTQLADVGQVAVLPGTPVALLKDASVASSERAIRSNPAAAPHTTRSLSRPSDYDPDPLHDPGRYLVPEVVASDAAGPTIEQMRSGPHPSVNQLAKDAPRVAVETPEPRPPASEPVKRPRLNVVLVCVVGNDSRDPR